MKLSFYKEMISRIDHILLHNDKATNIFRGLVDAFPGELSSSKAFFAVYREGISARELLRKAYPKPQRIVTSSAESPNKAKYKTRRSPYDVRIPAPRQSQKSAGEVFSVPRISSPGGVKAIERFEQRVRTRFEKNQGFHEILQAFCARLDQQGGADEEIVFPRWLVTAIADKIKEYHHRRFILRKDVTLDEVMGLCRKNSEIRFDPFTIDNSKILEKTRELQWYFGLSFSTAFRFAERITKAECAISGEEMFVYKYADLRAKELRGQLPSLGAWLEAEGLGDQAPTHLREDYLAYLDVLDGDIREDLEKALSDRRQLLKKR